MARPSYNADGDYTDRRQLGLVNTPPPSTTAITSRYSGFTLPDDWAVKVIPRTHSSRADKYYYEPGTGLRFRSLRAVEKYINGEGQLTTKSHAVPWRNDYKMLRLAEETLNKSQLAIVTSTKPAASSPHNLPDGWVVEEVPRISSSDTDKYYYEPGSGRKFRSLLAAQRHLAALNKDAPLSAFVAEIKDMKRPLSKAFKLCQGIKKSASCNKKPTRDKAQPSSMDSVPEKVEWVLASSRGDAWKPFVFDRAIPDSVKEQWKERFVLIMNVDNPDACDELTLSVPEKYTQEATNSLRLQLLNKLNDHPVNTWS